MPRELKIIKVKKIYKEGKITEGIYLFVIAFIILAGSLIAKDAQAISCGRCSTTNPCQYATWESGGPLIACDSLRDQKLNVVYTVNDSCTALCSSPNVCSLGSCVGLKSCGRCSTVQPCQYATWQVPSNTDCEVGTKYNVVYTANDSCTAFCLSGQSCSGGSCVAPPPACSSSAPEAPSTTAISGTFYAYAYGVQNATTVFFPTWGDPGGQDDLVWYPGTNLGGGTWRAAIDLGNHKAGNPEYGNFNVHIYMNNTFYTNQWCGTANFSRNAMTCTFSVSPTQVSANNSDTWTWTGTSNPSGYATKRYGTKNGVTDINGDDWLGSTNFSKTTGPVGPGSEGVYARWFKIFDPSTGAALCTSNSATLTVFLPTYVIDLPSATKQVGQIQQFTGYYDPDGPSGSQAQQDKTTSAGWSSSDTSVATISSGLATCVSSSATAVTITSVYSGITATVSLTCSAGPSVHCSRCSVVYDRQWVEFDTTDTTCATVVPSSNPIIRGLHCTCRAGDASWYNSNYPEVCSQYSMCSYILSQPTTPIISESKEIKMANIQNQLASIANAISQLMEGIKELMGR